MVPFGSGAPPAPYNLYGFARESDGATPLATGTRITAFVDGVDYSNGTAVYRADGAFDVDVFGDWVTQTGQPNTPAVKEGGNVGDETMFVAGDFTTSAQVFTTKKFWAPFEHINDNLQLAPGGNQPGLLKVGRITTRPADGLSQYLYLCNPTASVINADGYYLQKDVFGSFNGPQHMLTGVGPVGPGGLAYVNLTGALTFTPTGDNVKLVWRNVGGPAFGGTDVIVDRVEFNQTGGPGTLFWEPGNTVMTDAQAPGTGQEIRRDLACADTNSNAVDFTLSAETGRPGANTAPTVTLSEPNGGQVWTGGTVHPIRWTMSDVEDSSMTVATSLSLDGGISFPISVDSNTYPNGANSFSWTVNLVNTTAARIRVCAFDSGAQSNCAISAADFTIDSARPTLDATIPANGATGVDTNANIVLTFSEAMNRTATEGAVTISPSPGPVTTAWDGPGRTLTIDPTGPMTGTTLHTVTVSCAAEDVSDTGNALAACPRSFTFTTAAGAVAPTVDLTSPDGGQVFSGASLQTIAWTMSDSDTPGNLNVDLFYSTDSGGTWTPIVTAQSRPQGANTYTWSVPLVNTQTARARVCATDGTQTTCDASAADFAIDSIRPTVTSTDPATGATGIVPSRSLVILFSERMNQTATNGAFTITPNPGALAFSWNPAGDVLTINHNAFTSCTQHTATFAATAKDVSSPGNGLAAPYSWTFTTSCPPQITITAPAGGEVWSGGSSQNVVFTIADPDSASVSVWVNLSTDGGSTWTILNGPTVRTLGQQTVAVTLPTADATNALVRVTAQDPSYLDGVATSPAFEIDATAPTVTASVPAAAAVDVGVTADFTITFSEAMDEASTETAISLVPAAAPLTYSWNAASTVLTIAHGPLQTSTSYTLTVGTGAKDASSPGNAFASPHAIVFTTSSVGAVDANPGGPYTAQVGTAVQFDGSASLGTIVNYTWQVVLPTGSVFGYGERPVFTFQSAGTFTVTLTVRDGAGNTDSADTTVTVSGGPGEVDFLGQYWWLFLILIIAIVGALLFLLGKRRKKEEEMPEEVPPEEVETIPPAAKAPAKPAPKPAPRPAPPAAAPAAAPAKAKPATMECPSCGTIVDATDTDCFMCGAKL